VTIATADGQKRKLAGWGLRLLGPVVLVVVLWRLPEPSELLRLFANVDLAWLAASLVLNFAAIQLKILRWQAILRARSIHYGTRDAWFAFCSSLYLAMLTPGRVGDVLRIQYLRHDVDAPYSEGLASVVFDRLCDLYVLVGFVAVAIAHYSSVVVGDLRVVSWLVVAATAFGPLVFLVPGLAEKLFSAAYRKLSRDPSAQGLHTFLEALRAQVGKALFATVPLSVVSFLLGSAQAWLIARSLGIDLPYFDVVCLLAVANLLGLLPISMSGVGVREAFFAAVFPSLGLGATAGVAFGLALFAVIYVALALIGFVSWQIRPPPTGLPPRGQVVSRGDSP
jgi:glycosyltransferase 2 family protein